MRRKTVVKLKMYTINPIATTEITQHRNIQNRSTKYINDILKILNPKTEIKGEKETKSS